MQIKQRNRKWLLSELNNTDWNSIDHLIDPKGVHAYFPTLSPAMT